MNSSYPVYAAYKKIRNNQWYLTDKVINEYMKLIMARNKDVYAFDSFFYFRLNKSGYKGVQRWTKNVNIFSKRKLFIPINFEKPNCRHWFLICVHMDQQKISYYDSLKGIVDNFDDYMSDIQTYLLEEKLDKLDSILNTSLWKLEDAICPEQKNGMDCGVFVCVFAEYLSRGTEFNFTQDHMLSFRQLIAHELTIKKLIDINVSISDIDVFIKNLKIESVVEIDKENTKRKSVVIIDEPNLKRKSKN